MAYINPGPNPSQTVYFVDDFIASNTLSVLGWGTQTGGGGSISAQTVLDNGHPGVIDMNAPAAFANSAIFLFNTIIPGGGAIETDYVCKLSNLSVAADRYHALIGFTSGSTEAIANGIYFRYQDNANSGNWQLISVASSVATTVNSSIAADTNWHHFTIKINAAASSVTGFIDGVSVGAAITTNIPAILSPQVFIENNGASTSAARHLYLDLFYINQFLTTTR